MGVFNGNVAMLTKQGYMVSKQKMNRKPKRKPYIFYATQEYQKIYNKKYA